MKAKIYNLTETCDGRTKCYAFGTAAERDATFIKLLRDSTKRQIGERETQISGRDKELDVLIDIGDLDSIYQYFEDYISFGEITFNSYEHEVEIVEIAGNVIHDTSIKIGTAQRRADGSIFCWSTQADGKNYASIEQCQLAIENLWVPTFKENDFVPVETTRTVYLK